jgi:hypothetical protein
MSANIFPADSNSTRKIHSYGDLQQHIHDDLRSQHPEWIEPNGDCPTCETYERRLAELIGRFQAHEHELIAALRSDSLWKSEPLEQEISRKRSQSGH